MSFRCGDMGEGDGCDAIVFGGWDGNRANGSRYVTDGHTMIDLEQIQHPAVMDLLLMPTDYPGARTPDDVVCRDVIAANQKDKPAHTLTVGALYHGWLALPRDDGAIAWVNPDKLAVILAAVGLLPMVQYGDVLGMIAFGNPAEPAAILMPLRAQDFHDPSSTPQLWPRVTSVPDETQEGQK